MCKTKKSYINNILKNDKQFRIFNTLEQQDIYIYKQIFKVGVLNVQRGKCLPLS